MNFLLFNTKAGCAECHSGWRFTDDSFYDVGVAGDDIGRGAAFPGVALMQNAFKTPTLRTSIVVIPTCTTAPRTRWTTSSSYTTSEVG